MIHFIVTLICVLNGVLKMILSYADKCFLLLVFIATLARSERDVIVVVFGVVACTLVCEHLWVFRESRGAN